MTGAPPGKPLSSRPSSPNRSDADEVGELQVRAASVRGLASRYSGVTRQDEYCLGTDKGHRWLVIAVADGVSAGRHSQIAATIASRRGCQLLVDRLAHGPPEKIDWHQTVKAVAEVIIREGNALLAAGAAPADVTVRDVAAVMAATAGYAIVATSPGQDGFEFHVSPSVTPRPGCSTGEMDGGC